MTTATTPDNDSNVRIVLFLHDIHHEHLGPSSRVIYSLAYCLFVG